MLRLVRRFLCQGSKGCCQPVKIHQLLAGELLSDGNGKARPEREKGMDFLAGQRGMSNLEFQDSLDQF